MTDLEKLKHTQDVLFELRNSLINTFIGCLINKQALKLINEKLDDLDFKIYMIKSEPTRKLVEEARIKIFLESFTPSYFWMDRGKPT